MTNPAMHAIGCVNSLVGIGSLISGIYQGLADARGTPIEPEILDTIRWGPIALSAIIGLPASYVMCDRRSIDEMMENAPAEIEREKFEGCVRGCGPIVIPLLSATATAGFQIAGYYIGRLIN